MCAPGGRSSPSPFCLTGATLPGRPPLLASGWAGPVRGERLESGSWGFSGAGPPQAASPPPCCSSLGPAGPAPGGLPAALPLSRCPEGPAPLQGPGPPTPAPCSLGPSSPGVCGSRKLSPRRPLSPFVCSSKQKKHIHLCHQDPVLSPRDELTVVSVSCLPCDLYEGQRIGPSERW